MIDSKMIAQYKRDCLFFDEELQKLEKETNPLGLLVGLFMGLLIGSVLGIAVGLDAGFIKGLGAGLTFGFGPGLSTGFGMHLKGYGFAIIGIALGLYLLIFF